MTEVVTPEWVRDAIFYQIFPDRFAQSAAIAKPSNLEPWDGPPSIRGFKGGDLLGVVEHLDYLQDLGITALYLCPIFQSSANHRYHTQDYYRVDPLLGGDPALRRLLDAAHARGMHVILDGVFNHTGRGFFQFNHILENRSKSPYLDWFHVYGWPVYPYTAATGETELSNPPANYEGWAGLRELPKLNTNTPGVRQFLWDVAQYWIDFGADGWRLDVPEDINDDPFWQEFRRRVKGANPQAYIVGEIWHEARRWLQGDQFDAVMNYLFLRGAACFMGQNTLVPGVRNLQHHWTLEPMGGHALAEWTEGVLRLYPQAVNEVQLNLLDSHDTPRFLTMVGGDEKALRLAILYQMTYPGAPSIYYGDEIGIGAAPLPQPWDNSTDPSCRPGMIWDEARWNTGLRAYVKRAIALRKAYPVLRRGTYRTLGGDATLYAYMRQSADDTLLVVLNAGMQDRTVQLPLPAEAHEGQTWVDLWGGNGPTHVVGGLLRDLHLPAQSGAVLQAAPTSEGYGG